MNWIQQEKKAIFQTYKRQPLVLVKGRGSYVWDVRGRRYLDFFSGLAVNNLGQCHPEVLKALTKQARTLLHTSNLYYTLPQIRCAETLVKRSFPGRVFFANSGAEANECALKLSRRWGKRSGRSGCFEIISFENSFHGRTMGTISLTGQKKYQKGFDPLLPKVRFAKMNDIASVKKLLGKKTAAIFIEPVQGEGGIHIAEKGFLRHLRNLANAHKALLVFDEVQCGMGRTGELFAYQRAGVEPDILALAKGLGGGLPIGAAVAKTFVAELFGPGDHASTFGGNPVACAAASAVLNVMDGRFLSEVRKKGEILSSALSEIAVKWPGKVKEVRSAGLMIGVELKSPGAPIVDFCRENGLLINCTQETVLRIMPPLTVSPEEMRQALAILSRALASLP